MNSFGNSSSSIIGSKFYVLLVAKLHQRCECDRANHSLLVWHFQGFPSGEFPVGNAGVIKLHHLRGIAVVLLQHSGPPCLC